MSLAWGLFFLSDSFCVVGGGQRRYVRSLAPFSSAMLLLSSSAILLSSSSAVLLPSSLGGDASVFSFLAACFALFKP